MCGATLLYFEIYFTILLSNCETTSSSVTRKGIVSKRLLYPCVFVQYSNTAKRDSIFRYGVLLISFGKSTTLHLVQRFERVAKKSRTAIGLKTKTPESLPAFKKFLRICAGHEKILNPHLTRTFRTVELLLSVISDSKSSK